MGLKSYLVITEDNPAGEAHASADAAVAAAREYVAANPSKSAVIAATLKIVYIPPATPIVEDLADPPAEPTPS